MLFLSNRDKEQWQRLGNDILMHKLPPESFKDEIRSNLIPVFYCYAGSLLTSRGLEELGKKWFMAGAKQEEEGLFFNIFMTSFLERQNNRLIMPAVAFEDPRPYVHFTEVPTVKVSRKNFIHCCGHSLPKIAHPLKIMDLGCGNGALLVDLLTYLQEVGKIGDIAEILLVDPSAGMLEIARDTVGQAFSPHIVKAVNDRIEVFSSKLDAHYDIALSSLAYHHMPLAKKTKHLGMLRPWFDHFILFEIDANNETPEIHSPDLILSLYQSYGRLIDFVFAHDAPLDVAYMCVDCFLMTEVVSFLTQPYGVRTDYHMLRNQWLNLFDTGLGTVLTCFSNSTCYSDEYFDLYMIHYGRTEL